MHRYLAPLTAVAAVLILVGCAARVITYEQQLLAEADSLFRAGNYEFAKVKYTKVRDTKPESEAARIAQFNLGYINVFYDNPFANWEAALREFKTFATLYPEDVRVGDANSWIRILVVLQSFKKEYKGASSKLDQLRSKEALAQKNSFSQKLSNFEQIAEALRNCDSDTDSLKKRVKELEHFIVELEKRCVNQR